MAWPHGGAGYQSGRVRLRTFCFPNSHNRVKSLHWEHKAFCIWIKRLESESFETSPDDIEDAIVLTAQELNWLFNGYDL